MSKKSKFNIGKILSYEWRDIVKAVESISGRSVRDWAGRNKSQPTYRDYLSGNFPAAIWAKSKGYNWEVLNDTYLPDGRTVPRSDEDIELRCKINNEYNEYKKENSLEIPYQDFWLYANKNIFYDISNGCTRYFNPSEHLAEIEKKDLGKYNFVKEILPFFIRVLKEEGLQDEILVSISW